MSSRGHRRAGSRTGGKLARRTPCDVRRALTRATETAVVPLLAKRRARRSGRLPSCRDRPSVPSRRVALALVVESVARLRTPFSPPSPREPASAGRARNFGASVTPPIRLAALRVARRAMRRTDFCHLTTSYRYPCLVSFRRVRRFRACATGEIACCTAEQLASVGRTIPSCVTVVGVVFPPRCVRTEPLTPLSPPPRGPRRSRVHESSRGPPRSPSDRSRERDGHRDDPRCLPSSEDLCPATPFRAPGSGLFQLRGLATAMLASDAFESLGAPCGEPGGPGPRPRVPLPTGRHASLDLGVVRRLLQP